jgi:hypothetical protein
VVEWEKREEKEGGAEGNALWPVLVQLDSLGMLQ